MKLTLYYIIYFFIFFIKIYKFIFSFFWKETRFFFTNSYFMNSLSLKLTSQTPVDNIKGPIQCICFHMADYSTAFIYTQRRFKPNRSLGHEFILWLIWLHQPVFLPAEGMLYPLKHHCLNNLGQNGAWHDGQADLWEVEDHLHRLAEWNLYLQALRTRWGRLWFTVWFTL